MHTSRYEQSKHTRYKQTQYNNHYIYSIHKIIVDLKYCTYGGIRCISISISIVNTFSCTSPSCYLSPCPECLSESDITGKLIFLPSDVSYMIYNVQYGLSVCLSVRPSVRPSIGVMFCFMYGIDKRTLSRRWRCRSLCGHSPISAPISLVFQTSSSHCCTLHNQQVLPIKR